MVNGYWLHYLWILQVGEQFICVHKPLNKCDKNAITVIKDSAVVGYVPPPLSKDLFKVLESRGRVKIIVTLKPIYTMTRGLIIP